MKFENDDLKYLSSLPYVVCDKNTKKLKNVNIDRNLELYPNNILKKELRHYVDITYSTMFRLMLYTWLYKYDGKTKIIIDLKKDIKNNNKTTLFRAFNQIPTNRSILLKHINKYIGNINDTKSNNINILANLDKNKNIIFTEKNIINYIYIILRITKKSNNSEFKAANLIIKHKMFDSVRETTWKNDVNGIDLIGVKNDIEYNIQVKNPSKEVNIKIIDEKYNHILSIEYTKLDIPNYKKPKNIIWDYLVLLDNKNNIIYNIKALGIYKIINNNSNTINIYIRKEENNITTFDMIND